MNLQTIDKTITVPKELLRSWRGQRIMIAGDANQIIIQKVQLPKKDFRARMLKVGKGITRKDLANAIRVARTR